MDDHRTVWVDPEEGAIEEFEYLMAAKSANTTHVCLAITGSKTGSAKRSTLKHTTIRPECPQSLDEARKLVVNFVNHYNSVRLHSAIGFVTPCDKLAGREKVIWGARDRKLEVARQARATMRLAASHPVNQPAIT